MKKYHTILEANYELIMAAKFKPKKLVKRVNEIFQFQMGEYRKLRDAVRTFQYMWGCLKPEQIKLMATYYAEEYLGGGDTPACEELYNQWCKEVEDFRQMHADEGGWYADDEPQSQQKQFDIDFVNASSRCQN